MALEQRDDRAGCGVPISRISVVMVVFRPAVSKKERLGPIPVAALQRLLKVLGERARFDHSLQRKQNVRRVETIDPLLVRFDAVRPRAVRSLLIDDVTSGTLGLAT